MLTRHSFTNGVSYSTEDATWDSVMSASVLSVACPSHVAGVDVLAGQKKIMVLVQ